MYSFVLVSLIIIDYRLTLSHNRSGKQTIIWVRIHLVGSGCTLNCYVPYDLRSNLKMECHFWWLTSKNGLSYKVLLLKVLHSKEVKSVPPQKVISKLSSWSYLTDELLK